MREKKRLKVSFKQNENDNSYSAPNQYVPLIKQVMFDPYDD